MRPLVGLPGDERAGGSRVRGGGRLASAARLVASAANNTKVVQLVTAAACVGDDVVNLSGRWRETGGVVEGDAARAGAVVTAWAGAWAKGDAVGLCERESFSSESLPS